MKEVISVLERLEKESSNKVKLRILEENKDIYRLKEILEYTYNPFKRYGITEKTFENIITEKSISNFNNIFEVADRRSISNINNSLRVLVVSLVESLPNEDATIPFPSEDTTPPVTKIYFVLSTFAFIFPPTN